MRGVLTLAGVLLLAVLGCSWTPYAPGYNLPGVVAPLAVRATDNPLLVPVADREFLWNQLVDTIDDYFRIEREERIRQVGEVLTPGQIDTFPKVGSTLLEPWRRDSTPGFERMHSTLQSVRRRALLQVTPAEDGYLIGVTVLKELEDLNRPEHATAGAATIRHDGSLVRNEAHQDKQPVTLGWIPIGRDLALEQQILTDIQARLSGWGGTQRLPPIVR
jgi:hypothetical protein